MDQVRILYDAGDDYDEYGRFSAGEDSHIGKLLRLEHSVLRWKLNYEHNRQFDLHDHDEASSNT